MNCRGSSANPPSQPNGMLAVSNLGGSRNLSPQSLIPCRDECFCSDDPGTAAERRRFVSGAAVWIRGL
jgi:hypothetical protein